MNRIETQANYYRNLPLRDRSIKAIVHLEDSDAVALQKNSPVDLKIKDSILIEVTDSNNAYYSGEDTDVEIYGQYTTEAFFAAMQKNK